MNEWISVKDRLPKKEEEVLICFQSGNIAVGYWAESYCGEICWGAVPDDGWYTDCENAPLYWMPLPEPPKGGAE